MNIKLIETLEVGNELGEGVIWDHNAAKIWWTDILQSKLLRYDPATKELENWDTPERLCCFAPIDGQKGLVAAFESGFAFYTPESGQVNWLHKLESDNPGTRFNDGRVDRQGRLWSATMVEDESTASYKGSLYCLHNDLSISKALSGLSIPNSLCWSPDGAIVYHTDTPTQRINSYAFDVATGEFGEPKLLVKTEADCYPDGSIVDSEGYIWNAQWGGSKVVRYAPDGSTDFVLEIPTSQPSCVAFGGKDLDLLFVTSAHADMAEPEPQAGSLFIYQTDVKGLVERDFTVSS